jgi:hypothetical protein
VSAPVHPLRPPAPALGCKPFGIAAAWVNPTGLIRTVLTCLTDTSADNISTSSGTGTSSSRCTAGAGQQQQRHPGQSAWVCETWLVTLAAHRQQQQQPQVLDCQLLLVSQSPPAAAVGCAGADRLLLVAEPGLEECQLSTCALCSTMWAMCMSRCWHVYVTMPCHDARGHVPVSAGFAQSCCLAAGLVG